MKRTKKQRRRDEMAVLVSRTIALTDELNQHPRLMVALDHKRGLKLMPLNGPGVTAVNIIQMFMNVQPFVNVLVGDSLTLYQPAQQGYPLANDDDRGPESEDRRDIERTGSAVEEAGVEEHSPSKWFTDLQSQRRKWTDNPQA